MTHYRTSDIHVDHANIIEYVPRPFNDVDHMFEVICANWNAVVMPDDIVTIEGDFAMGHIVDSLPKAAELNGVKRLRPGNHDRCWKGAKGSPEKNRMWNEKYGEYFEILPGIEETTITNGEVTIEVIECHFPYKAIERHGDRYDTWAPDDTGKWLIHGHTHSRQKIEPEKRQVHVGTDAWNYTPVDEATLVDLIIPYL